MNELSIVDWLSTAIEQATRSAKFCVVGCMPVVDPGIEVDGLGGIKLPLNRAATKALIAACQDAPYGKGTETLIDKRVRNTYELDAEKIYLSDAWNSAITETTQHVAEQLGLPAEQLEARLYKLLVYEKGGFFLPHRDSEKHNRMVASMIVVLPNHFEGGALVVQHGTEKQELKFDDAAACRVPSYAAFYSDCEHEVQRVTHGVRLCLAYNLVVKPKRKRMSAAANPTAPSDLLAASIKSWIEKQPAKPLVFALEHHYTQRGLSLDLLKGADQQLADLVVAAAEQSDCRVHLSHVSRHLLQFADDGSFGRGYSYEYNRPRSAIRVGETYEDEMSGKQWTDIAGKKQPWGDIPFDLSAIVSAVPINDWKPTSEEFEGYTGNAGNTLDRWYHRSAIVVWHRDHHFDVVSSSGTINCIPLFCEMTAKLAKTAKKKIEGARADCIRFAKAIIARWPNRADAYGYPATELSSPFDDFPAQLLALHDRDLISLFLAKVAECDQSLRPGPFIVAASREFGCGTFALQLKQLITSKPQRHYRQDMPVRDPEWLCMFCNDRPADSDQTALARELCALAVARFCEPYPPQSSRQLPSSRRPVSSSEKSLPLLLKALLASGLDEELARVIQFVKVSRDEFRMDDCLVPCLNLLVPWSRSTFGVVHPQLASWLATVRLELEVATARSPLPPADWSRPSNVDCKCQYCARLKAFLADPVNEVARIPAREEVREYLTRQISRYQCDVKHALERRGSPFSLVLTKTSGSYERAVQRFDKDRSLLDSLPSAQ